MGTEVQLKSFFPRYYSSRVINEDSNGCNWPLYYTDQTSPNGHLSNSFQWVTTAAAATDASIDYDKFALKQKMLEHESVFKKQVHELHRLYRIQKDLMDEVKRKELSPYHAIVASNTPQASPFNGFSRPSKIGKEKLSLHLPAVVYIDLEESGENEVKDGFDLNQPAQMDDTASSDFVHPRSISFFESMVGAHQGSSHRGTNGYPGFKEKLCISSQQNLHNKIHEVPHLFNGHKFRIDHTRLLPTCGAESSKHWDSGVAFHALKHQIAASYDREESSSQLFENQSIHRSSAEKCEQPESSIFGKSLKNAVIDINLPCDDLVTEESPSTKRSTLKCDFDLNSCIDEDDTYCLAVDGRNMGVKIDLESPAFEDIEGSVCLEETAAEAIVAMSSSTAVEAEEVLSPDNLNWFVNIALRDQTKKMDYFESMTLKLTEMDEEEHLPKAFEVEDDEVGCAPTNTDRAHHRRRGRQKRRDFQRDILPGLTSLSSQEVAEDLQAFGGLMRATGHVWGPFGSSSRKGSCRGRRRTIARPVAVVPTVTDTALDTLRLEEGSLMGWGKTRRARQQRCPAGNFRSSINGSSSLLDCGSGCL